MTVNDLTGIPRPTVIRKLKIIIKQKNNCKKIKKILYAFIRGPGHDEMNKIRLQNIENISKTISRINNIIFFLK